MRFNLDKFVVAAALLSFGFPVVAQTLPLKEIATIKSYIKDLAFDSNGIHQFCEITQDWDAKTVTFNIIDRESLTPIKTFTVNVGNVENIIQWGDEKEIGILSLEEALTYDFAMAASQTLFNTDDKWEFAVMEKRESSPDGSCVTWKVMNEDGDVLGYFTEKGSLYFQHVVLNDEFRPRLIECFQNPDIYNFYSFTDSSQGGSQVQKIALQKATAYPSPLRNGELLNVVLDSALDRDATVEVMNVTGLVLQSVILKAGETKVTVAADRLPVGELIYRVIDGSNPIATGKILRK